VEEIVVTTSPLKETSDQLAIPIQVLGRDDVVDQGGATLGEALQAQPGITTNSFAAGASRPVIRGQDADRVKILESGGETGDVSTLSADHAVPINPLAVQRLEVVRGPATLRYGGGAIGGVVNAITSRIPGKRFGTAFGGELYSGCGIGAAERNLAGVLEGDVGAFSWHLDGLGVRSRDYEIPGTPDRQRNTDTHNVSLAGGGAWISDLFRLGASISRFRDSYGIPAGDPLVPTSISLKQDRYEVEFDATPGGQWIDQIHVRAGLTDYRHNELDHDLLAGVTDIGATFKNQEREVRTELIHQPIAGFTGALGVQYRDRDFFSLNGAEGLLPPEDGKTYAAYLFESRDLSDQLKLDLTGRVERVTLNGSQCPFNPPGTPADGSITCNPAGGTSREDTVRRTFYPLSASGSLLYSIADGWSAGLTLTAAPRASEPFELFSQGSHDASGTFEIGNPQGKLETSYTIDAPLRGQWGPVAAQLTPFYTYYQNFVFGRLTGLLVDAGTGLVSATGDNRQLVYSQDRARFVGGEFLVRWDVFAFGSGRVGLELQSDYVRARLSSTNVPRIPPFRWGAGLVFDDGRISGRLGFLHNDSQNELAPPRRAHPATPM
jgi:iron complex outermembrane receptor protein